MKAAFYLLLLSASLVAQTPAKKSVYNNADFDVRSASVSHAADLESLIFEQTVAGTAGNTIAKPAGQLHGAPVLGYVFPTTLGSEDVGFGPTEGVVALAVTSHPDFDDTPLWDENGDGNYKNDGVRWHTHWVVLTKDARVPGGLSVKEFRKADAVVLPPTNPGMPMYMDSPGHTVATSNKTLRVVVPVQKLRGKTDFRYDAVTCYMEVFAPEAGHTDNAGKPMLGVYEVFKVLSGDLSLPLTVKKK